MTFPMVDVTIHVCTTRVDRSEIHHVKQVDLFEFGVVDFRYAILYKLTLITALAWTRTLPALGNFVIS